MLWVTLHHFTNVSKYTHPRPHTGDGTSVPRRLEGVLLPVTSTRDRPSSVTRWVLSTTDEEGTYHHYRSTAESGRDGRHERSGVPPGVVTETSEHGRSVILITCETSKDHFLIPLTQGSGRVSVKRGSISTAPVACPTTSARHRDSGSSVQRVLGLPPSERVGVTDQVPEGILSPEVLRLFPDVDPDFLRYPQDGRTKGGLVLSMDRQWEQVKR